MAFFNEEQLAELSISRMIFHVVGPDPSTLVLLEEISVGTHAEFFVDRLRATNDGMTFNFAAGSSLEASLRKIAADPNVFVSESKGLATQFQTQHSGSASDGAFLLFVLESVKETFFAVVKYDHESVVSYQIKKAATGNTASMSALRDTFVKSAHALQKSALIRLDASGGVLCVRDRAAPSKVSQYFQGFLGATRAYETKQLTTMLCKVAKDVALKNADVLGVSVMSDLNKRIFDFVQATLSFDPADKEPFLVAVYGPLASDHAVRADFDAALKKERIESEAFDFDKPSVARPAKRRLITQEGIEVIWDTRYANSVTKVLGDDGRTKIIIDTGGVRSEDDYSDKTSRTR
jgi:hypothetical protein